MASATLAKARAAKEKVADLLSGRADVTGIGITRGDGGFAVKVHLSRPEQRNAKLPRRVDGVPVVVEVVGRITAR